MVVEILHQCCKSTTNDHPDTCFCGSTGNSKAQALGNRVCASNPLCSFSAFAVTLRFRFFFNCFQYEGGLTSVFRAFPSFSHSPLLLFFEKMPEESDEEEGERGLKPPPQPKICTKAEDVVDAGRSMGYPLSLRIREGVNTQVAFSPCYTFAM